MNTEYHVVFNVSSARITLGKAQTVLSVAQTHPEIANTLSACIVLLLAAALEQGTKSRLSYIAKSIAMEEEIDPSNTRAGMLSTGSLRDRMVNLPGLLTDDRLELIPYNPIVKHLHKLINVRNALLHIDEPAEHLITPDDRIVVDVEEKKMYVVAPIPKNPWNTVSLGEVENFQSAVGTYFSEVLFPESGRLEPGLILEEAN